jgi:hypothetical protein
MEMFAVASEIHTEDIKKLCGQKTEFFNIKREATQSNDQAFKG